jgi:Ferritin-like domain
VTYLLIDKIRILVMLQPAASVPLSPSAPITFVVIIMQQSLKPLLRKSTRRFFLRSSLAAPGIIGASLMASRSSSAFFDEGITHGDIDILRFLSALEIIESDLWQQYNELGGIQDSEVPGGSGNPLYTAQLQTLDSDMPQYIHDNTEDEFSHFSFINGYLQSKGAPSVNLDRFRTLQGSTATGAQKGVKRITNLMELTVDTSWWPRYRSRTKNPDLGDTFPQAIPGLAAGRFPAIPRSDADLKPSDHLTAIANTAGFHFGTIEQGGSSLYPALAQRVTNVEVLRILLSIGPTETAHFQTWHDKAGNFTPITDSTNGLMFPDLNNPANVPPGFTEEDFQTNLIMPEPTAFLSRALPPCSIIRPTATQGAAMGALNSLIADGLFIGQSPAFFAEMRDLATRADLAQREI